MKQFLFVSLAAILAIAFSAFTPKGGYYYFDGNSYEPLPPEVSPCPNGDLRICTRTVNGEADTEIYIDNIGTPLMTDEPPLLAEPVQNLYYRNPSNSQYELVPAGTEICPSGPNDQCHTTVNGVANTPLWTDAGITPYKKQ